MAQPADQVGAAVPFGGLVRVRHEGLRLERERAPHRERGLRVVREAQAVRLVFRGGGRHAAQVGVEGVGVFARDLREVRVREGRVQQAPVLAAAVVHGAPEMRAAPAADAVRRIGREVGRVDGAERRFERHAARIGLAAARGVAAGAVARQREVAPALDQLRRGFEGFGALGQRVFAAQVQRQHDAGQHGRQGEQAQQGPAEMSQSRGHRVLRVSPRRACRRRSRAAARAARPPGGCRPASAARPASWPRR
ncbi:hypothetical protein D9M68_589360 [compost metagenome]